ncbi:MAG: hypothetical protein ACRDKL_00960, partial [Solirubrobacteraceae bacterium]
LEQYVMADTFFTLTLLAAVLLVLWPRLRCAPRPRPARRAVVLVAVAGLLVAFAAIQRETGLWVTPIFVIYLLWRRVPATQLAAFVIALALPIIGYASLVNAEYGVFGLTATAGRTIYSRVAGLADCRGLLLPRDQRRLCETPAARARHPTAPDWYMFAAASPAQRHYNLARETIAQQARSDAILGGFAKRIILHQPLDYARSVLGDFFDFLRPGATAYRDSVSATSLPLSAAAETTDASVRRRLLPGLRPEVRAPARVVRWYRHAIHVPRPVLAVLAILSLLALVKRTSARREILLTAGGGLLLLLGTAATGGFGLRYLLPAVPLLTIGGALAMRDLAEYWPDRYSVCKMLPTVRRRTPGEPAPRRRRST